MIRTYIKIALRHLQKHTLYAGINLLGLAIGLSGCILIGLYIWHELSYDRFHEKAHRLVRVTWAYHFEDAENQTASTGTRVGPEFTRRFPEVEAYVRLLKYPRVLAVGDKMFEEKRFLYADSAFFGLFSFPLLEGNPATVLDAPEKLVITQSAAKKYFGSQHPIGRSITVGGTKEFMITGIAADAPANSQIQFDFVGSFTTLNAAREEKWSEANYLTFLQLHSPEAIGPLQAKIRAYSEQVGREELQLSGNNYMTYQLEPITEVHLYSPLDGFEPNSSITYIWVLAAVALLILLVACVNYTNLSTAQAAGRSAEIGMRKVMGASRRDIFFQFISEAFLLSLLAVAVALFLSFVLLPSFNQLAGRQLEQELLFQPLTLLLLLGLCAVVAMLAGAYPAMVLSGSKVIGILKKGFTFTGQAGLRKGLIVFQFVISIFLLIATAIILQQLSFIQNKALGYSKEHVLELPIDAKMSENYDALRDALENLPGVRSVAGAYEAPTHIGWSDGLTALESGKRISINAMPADEHLVKTLNLSLLAGEDFTQRDIQLADPALQGDNIQYTYMLNEAAVRALGWTPQQAIGKRVAKGREGIVRAVVQDFHFRSLHEPIGPLAIFMDKRLAGSFFVKIDGRDVPATLARLQGVWGARVAHRPFDYKFLDDSYTALYKAEQSIAGVFTTFATVAILLACLGLFALTAYAMVQRTKEIGIRKVLGATVADILALVSLDFIKLVLLAIAIAIPLAYGATSKWLEGFSYKIGLAWWVFGLAGLVTLLIAVLTVCLQALKTARANPVKNLRSE
ncbi:ABC transporter permease [Cesiribacter andamanensis]|uniref:Macrolide transporter ATP-binding /permease protein n=1 Tax=Cesiribacter andamanensis AMV16 TaxID=1279009 RepID=M7N9L4_9BACT|nr:ABC transporter permease [Cesiribacter andamanensis]EMR03962.1 macrolide transporter ATP-binding /permease protein [Cesiribacter andamanensis AMV16]